MDSDIRSEFANNVHPTGDAVPRHEPNGLSLTDLAGNVCKVQPSKGQIPVLESDPASNGCTYKTFPNAAQGQFDINSFYEREKPHSVWIETNLGRAGISAVMSMGSGAIVRKQSPTKCIVLTDRHVVRGTQQQEDDIADLESILKVKNPRPKIAVHATNGKIYAAEDVGEDPQRDLAALSVKTGKDTNAVCRPASIAQRYYTPHVDSPAYTISYPLNTATPYLSVGAFKETISLEQLNKREGAHDIAAQENPSRPLTEDILAIRHASSGAPRYDGFGRLTGLIDRQNNNKFGYAFSTPIKRSDIDAILSRPPVFPQ
jgi:S1-C subfamily serine protease